MAIIGDASTRDPPEIRARAQPLHESERTRVSRLWMPDGHVIRKEILGPGAEKRLRHEVAVLERLTDIDGVVRLAETPAYPGSIMLLDLGDDRLADRAFPLGADEVTALGLALSQVIGAVHRRGVVHRNVSPGNMMAGAPGRSPYLIGFGLATTFAEVRPDFTHANEVDGALPYLAPEQTGRTGRPVDHRADLYALGASLYEFATGAPPFGTGDPLRLLHDHLTQVPIAPSLVNPAVSPELSDVILHLLEKEPDNRYQTAEGLTHDLAWLRDGRAADGSGDAWQVGRHDFPLRMLPPSRVIGRDPEINTLDGAFAASLSGRCRGVMVSGEPGVGKTSLINELRPIVTARDGWFVSGKFDQYRRDHEFDASWQAFHGLGRLLLAEPERDVTEMRAQMLAAFGRDAGLLAAIHPDFAALLGVAPDPTRTGDPLTSEARLVAMSVEFLRIVVSPKRPVVFVVDDLQWAGRMPLSFLDMILHDDGLDGLLLVGAYREEEVDAAQQLSAMLARWKQPDSGIEHLRLRNLPPTSLATLLSDMLRVDSDDVAELASMLAPHTRGNPYDTIELLNSLRHDGLLRPAEDGWQWDTAALREHLGRADVAELLAERADAMPAPTRDLLESMACLGGRTEVSLIQAATGLAASGVEERLDPPLDAGLVVMEPGTKDAVRFRHDRVQETLLLRMGESRRHAVRLRLARRLAAEPELYGVAAQQYLPVMDAVRNPEERRGVADLLQRAADQAKMISNHAVVERCLTAAVPLIDESDTATLIRVHTGRLAALYGLGRLHDADEVYRIVDGLATRPLDRAEATLVQVSSLTNRRLPVDAIRVGLDLLRRFGCDVPERDALDDGIERGLDVLHRWIDEADEPDRRPDITDPTLVATAALINRIVPAAYTADQPMMAWLVLRAVEIWAEHGPARTLVGPMSHLGFVSIARRGDYRAGERALRRLLAVSEARDYEPDVAQAWFLYSLGTGPWVEPIEQNVPRALRAREELLRGGDLQNGCFTYIPTMQQLLDCGASLDSYLLEIQSGQALAARTGNDLIADMIRAFHALVVMLRDGGETVIAEMASPVTDANTPPAMATVYVTRAIGAALLGDGAILAQHTAAMMPLLPAIEGMYLTAPAHMLRALSLAEQARAAPAAERDALLTSMDVMVEWLAARAVDAPDNFLHLLRLVEAERSWAVGDYRAASYAFDVAQRQASDGQRPWHMALIHERAARFYLAQSMEHAGYALLAAARREYLAWGAAAKVDQLNWAYPTLRRRHGETAPDDERPGALSFHRSSTMTGAIDLLGILSASQALSSATSIDSLHSRVVEVLSAMTGATLVHLLVWNGDEQNWLLLAPGAGDGAMLSINEPSRQDLLPLSVVRYAERTREPLVLNDATRDDRFARDPYFAGLDHCSVLVVPILNRGMPQALLLLENRLIRAAFSADRLDGVMLIAGQLAVSLDNARIYGSLERKVAERTEQLALANERLERLSVTDPVSGLANRRRLEEVLDTEWRRGQRTGAPVGLAMVDIDHFKLYNDQYGHLAGDGCLLRIASELRRHIRDLDLVARYGGEEFAVVMPHTDLGTSVEVAERLRSAIAALGEPHVLGPDRIVTVSIGVATMVPSRQSSPGQLIEAADVELYKAKRSGRNRVRATIPGGRA